MNHFSPILRIVLSGLCFVLPTACSSSDDPVPVDHSVDFRTDGAKAVIGRTYSVEDRTENVAERCWRFQDAEPATSDKAAVDLKFGSLGTKNCSLRTIFTDGSVVDTPFTVEVSDYKAEVAVDRSQVYVGETVTVTDLSLHVLRRDWTLVDAKATYLSNALSEAYVTFLTPGVKSCSLTVTFDNGSTDTAEFTVDVLQGLGGTIVVSGLNDRNTAVTGSGITFSIGALTGTPSTYAWTFAGASAAASSEAAPTVSWEQEGCYAVACTLNDGTQELTLTTSVQVADPGRTPLLAAIDEYDCWGFESTNPGPYTLWSNADEAQNLRIVEGGANGSAHALKVSVDAATAETWQLFPRYNWNNNARLTPGKRYELSFYARVSDTKLDAAPGCGLLMGAWVVNYLDSWFWNAVLGKEAGTNWSEYSAEEFRTQGETVLGKIDGLTADGVNLDLLLTEAWTRCRVGFTAPAMSDPRYLNVYPFFLLWAASAESFYFDEIQIYEID